MSDNPFNPYQAPPDVFASSDGGNPDPTLDRSVDMLRQTKPWVRFISVVTFLGSALMVLVGAFMMLGGAAGATPGFGVGVGIVYIVMALIYIIPALFLWMYADRIALFVRERSTVALASALEAQKSFWKFVGILMLVFIALYAVGIFLAIIVGVAASVR
ncbi:MAG TPA: hypothetical protein VJL29_03690 [Thermoguttaceae bacterium]|nr:hypothetical protein [Thermoguttaceae bacterium]